MRASSAAEKSTVVHQQGCKGMPVCLACSIAHWLGLPHSGQSLADGVLAGNSMGK
jgi:hypothetical protein